MGFLIRKALGARAKMAWSLSPDPARLPGCDFTAALAASFLERSNCDEITVTDRPKVIGMQREQGLSFTRGGHEFDFQCIRSNNFNDRAEIATSQLGDWNIVRERHCIKQLVHKLPRERSYEP